MERIIKKQITGSLATDNFIGDSRHGFLKYKFGAASKIVFLDLVALNTN